MRRVILLLAAMATVGLLGTGDELFTDNQRADAQATSRPNIVFVMTDDQAESTLSYMPYVQSLIKEKRKRAAPLTMPSTYTLCVARAGRSSNAASMPTTPKFSATDRRTTGATEATKHWI
jgi:hypothetical protein